MISELVLFMIAGMIAIQGLLLLHSPDPDGTVTANAILWIFGDDRHLAGLALITSSGVAVFGILSNSMAKKIMMASPQIVVSVLYAAAAISAILSGSYADGVLRPPSFIAYDQIVTIMLAFIHTACITELVIR